MCEHILCMYKLSSRVLGKYACTSLWTLINQINATMVNIKLSLVCHSIRNNGKMSSLEPTAIESIHTECSVYSVAIGSEDGKMFGVV